MTTGAFIKYANNPNKIQESATHIMRQCNSYYDNIDTPTDTMQTACNQLNTTERVKLAYNWCSELHENEEQYRERIIRETGDSTHVDRKIAMMKQACNSVFCNENDTALGYITEEQICFPPPPDIDPATGDIIEEEELPDPEPPNTNEAQNFVKTTLKNIQEDFVKIYGNRLKVIVGEGGKVDNDVRAYLGGGIGKNGGSGGGFLVIWDVQEEEDDAVMVVVGGNVRGLEDEEKRIEICV